MACIGPLGGSDSYEGTYAETMRLDDRQPHTSAVHRHAMFKLLIWMFLKIGLSFAGVTFAVWGAAVLLLKMLN